MNAKITGTLTTSMQITKRGMKSFSKSLLICLKYHLKVHRKMTISRYYLCRQTEISGDDPRYTLQSLWIIKALFYHRLLLRIRLEGLVGSRQLGYHRF